MKISDSSAVSCASTATSTNVSSGSSVSSVSSLAPSPEILAAGHASIEKAFAARCPQSLLLHSRAVEVFPGGVTHDNGHVNGPSLFIRKAQGARKSDQDGNQYGEYEVGQR